MNVGVMICCGGLNGMEAGSDGIDGMPGTVVVGHERMVQTRAWKQVGVRIDNRDIDRI